MIFLGKKRICLLTPIGKPDDGLVCCKYCAVSWSAWKKSSPLPSKEKKVSWLILWK